MDRIDMLPEAGVRQPQVGLHEIALREYEGEPRARDLDIAERLGFKRARVIRELIERNRSELESFGEITPCRTAKVGRGRPEQGYLLNEEQALLVATISSAPNAPAVRSMLIRTFVAWRRGHLPDALSPEMIEMLRRTDGIVRMLASKVTGIERAIAAPADVAALIRAEIASQNYMLRRGRTAGQIWSAHGFPRIKGMAAWFGNRLEKVGCRIEGNGCGELGGMKARLFDPDKAEMWLRNGGRLMVEMKIAERRGQGKLRLVSAHESVAHV